MNKNEDWIYNVVNKWDENWHTISEIGKSFSFSIHSHLLIVISGSVENKQKIMTLSRSYWFLEYSICDSFYAWLASAIGINHGQRKWAWNWSGKKYCAHSRSIELGTATQKLTIRDTNRFSASSRQIFVFFFFVSIDTLTHRMSFGPPNRSKLN